MTDDERAFGTIGNLGNLGSIGIHKCCKCGKTLGLAESFCANCSGVLGGNVLGLSDNCCEDSSLKCNLCCFAEEGDPVTIGTKAGATIAGTVAELLCNGTVIRLIPGAEILPPGAAKEIVTTQPTFICCDNIDYLLKEDVDLPPK